MNYVLKNEKGLCLCYGGYYRKINLNNIQGGKNDVIIYGSYKEAKNDLYKTEKIGRFRP